MENRLYPRLAELAVYGCDDEFGIEGKAVVYHIVRGNSAGHFAITTDENTNAGILQVIKVQYMSDPVCTCKSHGVP